jgi:hypothetical protein
MVLSGIVSQEAVPPAARVSAAGILLDRGWDRALQPHAGEDGGGKSSTAAIRTDGVYPTVLRQ